MSPEFSVSAIFLSFDSTPWPPLPSTSSSGLSFAGFNGNIDDSDFPEPIPRHFVSFVQRYLAAHRSFAPQAARCAGCLRPGFWSPVPRPVLHEETLGSPRFLGNPCARALHFDPGAATPRLALQGVVLPSTQLTVSAGITNCVFRGSITRPTRLLSTLRSAGHPTTTLDSLPAGCPPSPGGIFAHGVPIEFRCL